MGYPIKIQVIKRKRSNVESQQWYINFPTALAQAMEFEKGEVLEWHIKDKNLLALKRQKPPAA